METSRPPHPARGPQGKWKKRLALALGGPLLIWLIINWLLILFSPY